MDAGLEDDAAQGERCWARASLAVPVANASRASIRRRVPPVARPSPRARALAPSSARPEPSASRPAPLAASWIPPRTWPTPAVARARLRPTRPTLPSGLLLPVASSALPCLRSGLTAAETRAGPDHRLHPGQGGDLALPAAQRGETVGLGDRPVFGGGDDDEGRFEARTDRAGERVRCRRGPGCLGSSWAGLGGPVFRPTAGRGEQQDDSADRDRRRRPGRRRAAGDERHQRPICRRRAPARSASGRGWSRAG